MDRPTERKRKPEQLAAKPTYAGSNANTMRNVGGAYGFSAGFTGGAAIGAAVGTVIGLACGGLPTPFTALIGMGVGATVCGSSGAGLGRYVGKKLEKKAAEEQKDIFGLQAEDTLIQQLIESDLKKEIQAMEIFITHLVKNKIVLNTKSDFFNEVNDEIFSSTQKELYNAMLDEHILKLQIASNKEKILRWGDSLKASTILQEIQIEHVQFKKNVMSLTTQNILDKRNQVRNNFDKKVKKPVFQNRTLDHLITLVLGNTDPKEYFPWLQKLKKLHQPDFNLFSSCKIIISDEKEKNQVVHWHGIK